MTSFAAVEHLDVLRDGTMGHVAAGVAIAVDQFTLERAEQAFEDGAVTQLPVRLLLLVVLWASSTAR